MIVSWKGPDTLLTEVRAKKLRELSEYQQKPPTEKAKDIMQLLVAMKGISKKLPADAMKDEEQLK